jgi:hypothetical protein
MESAGEPCPICRTKMKRVARQPVDAKFEAVFFKCPMCAKLEQLVIEAASVPRPEAQ